MTVATQEPCTTQREIDARKITCRHCHAPVGAPCVGIAWLAGNDGWVPNIIIRPESHAKRFAHYQKVIKKYGYVRSLAQERES